MWKVSFPNMTRLTNSHRNSLLRENVESRSGDETSTEHEDPRRGDESANEGQLSSETALHLTLGTPL